MIVLALLAVLQAENAPAPRDVRPRVIYAPNLGDFYPPASLRAEEQGQTRLRCELRVDGRLQDCVLAQSSGFAALDAASFRVAAQMRYTPMVRDGVARATPVIVPVRWQLGD